MREKLREGIWGTNVPISVAPGTRHISSVEAIREIAACHGKREISDECAATIASWWMSPGTTGMPFTILAQGNEVGYADLRDAIMVQYTWASPNDKLALDMLGTWALNGPGA
jgi:hypothetical protein